MTDETMINRIRILFQRVLRVDPVGLTEETRRGQLEAWDSLSHLMIIKALKDEFHVEVSPEQTLEIDTIGDIKRFLEQKSAVSK